MIFLIPDMVKCEDSRYDRGTGNGCADIHCKQCLFDALDPDGPENDEVEENRGELLSIIERLYPL